MIFFKKGYNKYDRCILLLIVSLAFGNVGGALQFSRFFSILFIPYYFSCYPSCAYYARNYYKFFAALIIYGIFSLLWSFDASRGVEELIYYFVHAFLFLEILVFSRKAHNPADSISLGWTISVALTLIVALWEITTDNHLSYSQQQSNEVMNVGGNVQILHRFASVTFYNYNSYVTYLCLALPFILYRMRQFALKKKEKIFVLAVISLAIVCILFNGSRGGALSCLIVIVIFLMTSKSRKAFTRILFVIIIAIAVVMFIFKDELLLILSARLVTDRAVGEESRWSIWEAAIKLFFHTFGLGVGLGGMSGGMSLFSKNGYLIPHNMLLEILVRFGFVFFSIVCTFLLKMFFGRKRIEDKNIRTLITMILFSMPIFSIIDSGYLFHPHFYAFFASLVFFFNYKRIRIPNRICIKKL